MLVTVTISGVALPLPPTLPGHPLQTMDYTVERVQHLLMFPPHPHQDILHRLH